MQSSRGIGKSILLSIICFYILTTIVCASGMNDTLTIYQNVSSSPLEKITAIPSTVLTMTPSLEIHGNTAPLPNLTTSPTSNSKEIILANINNQRIAPLNPDFIAYQQTIAGKNDSVLIKSLQVSEKGQRGLGFVPPIINFSYTQGSDVSHSISSNVASSNFPIAGGQYPSLFDLRTLTKVTPVRDQWTAGSCWAQATYASLESYLLPAESWDFSENNMKNLLSSAYPEGFDRDANLDGGNALMSTAYLARWTGPISEADDPYDASSTVSPTDIPARKHVQRVVFLPDRSGPTDNNNIKTALMTYGVVYTSMYYHTYYDNYTNAAYYFYDSTYANHAVGIVGWDDNYSRYNFTTFPPADGAFIVKNSWGTSFGKQGYFYISYYDTRIGLNNALFTAESAQNYDSIYQYDPLGWVNSIGIGGAGTTAWGANVFTSNTSETLSAVSFYATDTNTSYDLYIYKNPDNGPVNTTNYSYREKGTLSGPPGYYSKVISPGLILQPDEKFSIVMNLTTPNYPYPLPVEYAYPGYSSQATAHSGESYYSFNGGQTWSDITELDPTENICFKAFTIFTPPTAAFSANVTSGHAPLTVEFTDNTTGSPTGWNWSFGDGNVTNATVQNPVYTYLSGGKYTVSLTASNLGRSNTTTKTKYISVIGGNDGIAIFRPSTGYWYFDYNLMGVIDNSYRYGGDGDQILRGDWEGTGADGIAIFRPSTGYWYFDYNNNGIINNSYRYGGSTDQIIKGDWDGDGKDGIAIFRPSTGYWYFDNNLDGIVNTSFRYGGIGDQIIKGDWDGDGKDGIAIFRPSTGYWYFDNNLDSVVDKFLRYGGSTDQIIVGKWNSTLQDGIAIFRSSTGYWYFDYNLDGIVDNSFRYGGSTDQIIKGDWDGDGKDGIAIFRSSTGYWYFDYNLDGVVDKSFRYGGITDQIIFGKWA